MRIENLERHREHVATLAAWHHAEWAHLYDGWTQEMALAELSSHAGADRLPTSLVLLEGPRVLGSVSLVLEDAAEFCSEGSPWLANLYVLPEERGRGFGAELVRAAVAVAASQKIDELFLFTPGHSSFYQRLGWRILTRTTLHGTPVHLMQAAPMALAA
jgi:predicted N-acetyltransferase YhbS